MAVLMPLVAAPLGPLLTTLRLVASPQPALPVPVPTSNMCMGLPEVNLGEARRDSRTHRARVDPGLRLTPPPPPKYHRISGSAAPDSHSHFDAISDALNFQSF